MLIVVLRMCMCARSLICALYVRIGLFPASGHRPRLAGEASPRTRLDVVVVKERNRRDVKKEIGGEMKEREGEEERDRDRDREIER